MIRINYIIICFYIIIANITLFGFYSLVFIGTNFILFSLYSIIQNKICKKICKRICKKKIIILPQKSTKFIPCDNIKYKLSENQKNNEIVRIIKHIKNINSKQIVSHNKIVSKITNCNINNNNPTACGTYSNSLFSILSEMNYYVLKHKITKLSINSIYNYMEEIDMNNNYVILQFSVCCDTIILENSKRIFFPGHSFVIIKLYENKYIFSQSYIDTYDHKKYILQKTFLEIIDIIAKFEYIIMCQKIDDKFVQYWKDITKVNVSSWKNAIVNNKFMYYINYISL
jgi:hypothetical protein